MEQDLSKAINRLADVLDKTDENRLLDVKEISKEYNIGINYARKIISDRTLPVQRYCRPYKVRKKELDNYFSKQHDYLKEKN